MCHNARCARKMLLCARIHARCTRIYATRLRRPRLLCIDFFQFNVNGASRHRRFAPCAFRARTASTRRFAPAQGPKIAIFDHFWLFLAQNPDFWLVFSSIFKPLALRAVGASRRGRFAPDTPQLGASRRPKAQKSTFLTIFGYFWLFLAQNPDF